MSSSRNYGFDVYKENYREKYKTQRFCVLVSIKYLKHLHIYINYFKNYYDKIFKILLTFYHQQQQQHLRQWKHCQQQQNGIWKYNNSPEN